MVALISTSGLHRFYLQKHLHASDYNGVHKTQINMNVSCTLHEWLLSSNPCIPWVRRSLLAPPHIAALPRALLVNHSLPDSLTGGPHNKVSLCRLGVGVDAGGGRGGTTTSTQRAHSTVHAGHVTGRRRRSHSVLLLPSTTSLSRRQLTYHSATTTTVSTCIARPPLCAEIIT